LAVHFIYSKISVHFNGQRVSASCPLKWTLVLDCQKWLYLVFISCKMTNSGQY